MLVATDYFTKWVETEAYAQVMATQLIQFVEKNIVCRFGVPHSIVSDNGPQFISKAFHKFCMEYRIKNVYSTPRYPQSNGQAEVTNKTLLGYLKKLLTTVKGKWMNELPIELWAYRTTPKQPTGETPYALAYGVEAQIPIKSSMGPYALKTLSSSNKIWTSWKR